MGAANSNLTQSSEAGTLNWDDVKTEQPNISNNNGISIKKLDNGMEEIDIEINPLSDSENSIADISNVFQKLEEVARSDEENENEDNQGSSPFISTELYKKIMQGGENDSSSPFISTEVYKKIMKGGAKDLDDSSSSSMSDSNSESSTSSSELLRALSEITVSSSDDPRKNQHKNKFKKHHNNESKYHSHKHEKHNEPAYGSSTSSVELKGYGFSETSSEMPQDSNNYFVGGNSTETPYNVNSSSIATSDINLVSVDSVNGRRFINKN
tara:strand:- start:638 stop:1441 length:804 start_codon:yes stop_codon:yes gene_type:complete